MSIWDKWSDRHDTEEQKKRFASAKKVECTPLSVDAELAVGTFSGSHGLYKTGLSDCSCFDFTKRSLPCKHMYRLAVELGVEKGSVLADARRVKTPHPADNLSLAAMVDISERLPESAQLVFKDFLLETLYRKAEVVGYMPGSDAEALLATGLLERVDVLPDLYVGVELRDMLSAHGVSGYRKNASLASLAIWCRENAEAASVVLSELVCVELAARCKKRARYAYSYLMRRYDVEEYFDEDGAARAMPKGASFHVAVSADGSELSVVFPDDEVTALLDKYGVNPCTSWRK